MTNEMKRRLAARIHEYRNQNGEPACEDRNVMIEKAEELLDEVTHHIDISEELLSVVAEHTSIARELMEIVEGMMEVLQEGEDEDGEDEDDEDEDDEDEDPEVIVYCCECPCREDFYSKSRR